MSCIPSNDCVQADPNPQHHTLWICTNCPTIIYGGEEAAVGHLGSEACAEHCLWEFSYAYAGPLGSTKIGSEWATGRRVRREQGQIELYEPYEYAVEAAVREAWADIAQAYACVPLSRQSPPAPRIHQLALFV